MSIIHITAENYEAQVVNAAGKVLLDFWAPWCGPCRMVSPILDEIAGERPDVKVCKINVDNEMELAKQYRIFSIPTLIVMKDGQIESKMVGAKTKEQLLAAL